MLETSRESHANRDQTCQSFLRLGTQQRTAGFSARQTNPGGASQGPEGKVPGTKMVFAGIKDEKKIQDLIAFLKQFDAVRRRSDRLRLHPVAK